MVSKTNYKVDPHKKLSKKIVEASKKAEDLRVPLNLITQSWYKTNRAIFSLKGKGKYDDLSPKYKKRKLKNTGFVYPILLGATGRLAESILSPTSQYAINVIKNKKILELGVRKTPEFPYPAAHHFGFKGSNIPARPFLFIGGEAAAPRALNRRVDIWIDLIKHHVIGTMK